MPDWITLFSNPSTSITTALFLLGFAFMLIFTLTNLIWGIKNPKSEKATQAYYRAMIGIHGIGYFLILIFSLMFVDSSPIFENRIIMPYVISLLICIMIIISALWQQKNKVSISIGIMIFALSCALFIPESIQTANELSQFGQGYNTYHWKVSQTIAKVKTIDEETIYSNKPNALYILANKPSYTITSPYNPATQQYRENYQKNFNTIKNRILSGDAIMVIFDYQSYLDDPQNPDHEWMIELTEGLPIIEGGDDGVMFGITD